MKKRIISILGQIIKDMKRVAGEVKTAEYLFRIGCDKKELLLMGFNESKINSTCYFSEPYELMDVCGQVALFTNERIGRGDVPRDLFVYHLRGVDDDSLRFGSIEPNVSVNHAGSVICKNKIDFGKLGYISFCTEGDEPNFFGNELTISEYLEMDFE